MKKCPNCSQTFSDENYFCLNDGATLADSDESGINPPPFAAGDSLPTQVVSRPSAIDANASNDSSKWLYLIIGVLATALAGLAIFMFVPREKSEKSEVSNQNSKTEQTPDAAQNTNQAENVLAENTRQNLPRPTGTNPNLSPGGNWSGDLAYPWGTTYSAKVDLTDDGNGKVRGKVVWTLVKSKKAEEIAKLGAIETEYVQGTFDKAAQTIFLTEYDNDNPSNLLNPTKYNLALSEDNNQLKGVVYGKKRRWDFNLRRF